MFSRVSIALVASLAWCAPAVAQESEEEVDAAIIVTAERLPGSIETDVPPVATYDENAISSIGASNLTDILAAVSPQTRGGSGRNSGPPAILLNGRRISGFTEIRDLPPEAIRRVEVFPEDVALRYGFPPDQRVMNFILKDDFTARTAEIEWGSPTAGDRDQLELQGSMIALHGKGRTNLSATFNRDTPLLETDRGIVQQGSAFRTLLPRNRQLQLNAVHSRGLSSGGGLTLNLGYDRGAQKALLGVITGTSTPVVRTNDSETLRSGLTLDGMLGRWRWTLNGALTDSRQSSLTDRSATLRDQAVSDSLIGNAVYTLTGSPFRMPAGRATLTTTLGFERRHFTSRSDRALTPSRTVLDRGDGNGRINLDLPIASRREAVLSAIGDLSINANYGYQRLTDFGGLQVWGYGANWSPILGLSLSASFKAEDRAPTPQQLGDARVVTPNVPVFDFARGETVLVNLISGGNRALVADQRRDWQFSLAISPPKLADVSLDISYSRAHSDNPVSQFPSLTALTQTAFPGRIVRDGNGQIISVDQSPVNFVATQTDTLRWGVNFSHGSGPPGGPGGGRPGIGGGPGGPRPGGGGPGGAGPRGGGRGGGMPAMFGGGGKRVFASIYHSVKFRDDVVLAPGLPPIDLLGGGTVAAPGGSPRHSVQLESGYFNKGFGTRISGTWQSPTRVDGSPYLRFSGLFTLSIRAFYSFDQNKPLVTRAPFLKGSRLALRLLNVTNAIQSVRDGTGATPFRFQRGYLDPLGRVFEVSFRKLF